MRAWLPLYPGSLTSKERTIGRVKASAILPCLWSYIFLLLNSLRISWSSAMT
jgi:hypothetical protein